MITMRSLMNLFETKRRMGLDIGSSCVKVVKLERTDEGFRLLARKVCRAPDSLQMDERGRQIQRCLQEGEIASSGSAVINIEDPTLFIRRMDLPKMPDRDMKTAIKWNFREFVSGSVEDYLVNYIPILGIESGDKIPISAFCVSRGAIQNRQTVMRASGLRVSAIEPNATALLAAFNNAYPAERNKYFVIVDLGDSISNFIVVGNGSLMFSRPLSHVSGRELFAMVTKDAPVGVNAEERLKKFLAKPQENRDEYIESKISDFISDMIVEVQRSIDGFCIMYKKDKVDSIYICGGGVCLPDIKQKLSNGLGIEVEHLNPFKNILDAETAFQLPSAPLYAVAVGLALPGE